MEGTGVGLALSKQLVEVMGGVIGVDSVARARLDVLGRAARRRYPAPRATRRCRAPSRQHRPPNRRRTAAVRIPPRATGRHGLGRAAPDADPDAAAPANGAPPRAASGRGVVVLQIEDNPSNSALVEQVLAKRPGVRLISAGEGRAGLELARQHRPDLVLLDLHLPDLPGDELLHRLKAVPELADTKVVVVSADATPSRIREMLDLGVEGYLTKPVDVEALLRLVDYEIGAKQGEPQ